jgi:hypothetical protein
MQASTSTMETVSKFGESDNMQKYIETLQMDRDFAKGFLESIQEENPLDLKMIDKYTEKVKISEANLKTAQIDLLKDQLRKIKLNDGMDSSELFLEKYSRLISYNGVYSKWVKVLFINKPGQEISFWVDLRLYYDNKPTSKGVRFTAKEFELFISYLDKLGLITPKIYPYVDRKELKGRDWQMFNHEFCNRIWYIELNQQNGKKTKIGMEWTDYAKIYKLRDEIMEQCSLDAETLALL